MSPFLFFSNEKRSQIQNEFPDMKITEVSAKLGEIWRQMSEEEKAPYVEKSKSDRDRYKTQQSEFKGKNPQLTSVLFFSSPIIEERDNLRLKKMLNNFFDKIKKIFTKCCFESMINIRHQMETTQTILSLFLAYNSELKQSSNLNINTLKQCYSKAICSLLDY